MAAPVFVAFVVVVRTPRLVAQDVIGTSEVVHCSVRGSEGLARICAFCGWVSYNCCVAPLYSLHEGIVTERREVRSQTGVYLRQIPELVALQVVLTAPAVAVTAQGVGLRGRTLLWRGFRGDPQHDVRIS
ncbi:hypothetical protein BC826DRAFT_1088488, partial [Russula brevipes]